MSENASASFVLKGDIVYSLSPARIECRPGGLLVVTEGVCRGVYDTCPDAYAALPRVDCRGKLVMPGLVDLHIHAPQFSFRGTGMDLELLPWLNTYTFPEEAKFSDPDYARQAYGYFADRLKHSATTRACIFATRHKEATLTLMEKMEETGLCSYVGKINMDRCAIPALEDAGFLDSAYTTFGWINAALGRFQHTHPILTPRFVPCCSDELMGELSEIRRAYDVPVQSHLSENPGEVQWVRELCPWSRFYGDAYDRFGLFGGEARTVMAHCIYSTEEEIDLMQKRGVFVAHCPSSNMNLSSGIAPVRRYLDRGLRVGLGSDVAGGETESLFRTAVQAIQVSKLYWRLCDESAAPLTFDEAFYMATLGGGAFFGQVGSFAPGYEADVLVVDESAWPTPLRLDLRQRAERAFYLGMDQGGITAKYVAGRKVL